METFFRVVAPLLLVLTTVATGCSSTLETFTCDTRADCESATSDGACEESKFCSFPDGECVSGRRYGKLSGELSLLCVLPSAIDAGVADAAIVDAAPVDAQLPMIDAEAIMIDASTCMVTDQAIECPLLECQAEVETCCVYQRTTDELDCHGLCLSVGLSCQGAAESDGTCSPLNMKSCGNNNINNICFCE